MFPHWHPEDEHVVVVQGTWYLGAGDRFSRSDLREMTVGAYALVPKKMNHFAWSKGDTIIQVHGIGPFRITFVDDLKLLRDPGAASLFKFKPLRGARPERQLGYSDCAGRCGDRALFIGRTSSAHAMTRWVGTLSSTTGP